MSYFDSTTGHMFPTIGSLVRCPAFYLQIQLWLAPLLIRSSFTGPKPHWFDFVPARHFGFVIIQTSPLPLVAVWFFVSFWPWRKGEKLKVFHSEWTWNLIWQTGGENLCQRGKSWRAQSSLMIKKWFVWFQLLNFRRTLIKLMFFY